MNSYQINKRIAEIEGLEIHPLPQNYTVCVKSRYGVVKYDPANSWEQGGPTAGKAQCVHQFQTPCLHKAKLGSVHSIHQQ